MLVGNLRAETRLEMDDLTAVFCIGAAAPVQDQSMLPAPGS